MYRRNEEGVLWYYQVDPFSTESMDVNLTQVDVDFLLALQQHGEHGQKKHNQPWTSEKYLEERNCISHIQAHLIEFQMGRCNDITNDVEGHLLSIAFNAMMEWWYQKKLKEKENG